MLEKSAKEFACLDHFQNHLHSIYSVNVPHAVSDFVTTDKALMSLLSKGDKVHLKEKLLVYQEGENLDLSLYLHRDVVGSLAEKPLENYLHQDELENLCHVIEGISHFLYLIWRALRQREVSLLELELQAEIDKYIVLVSLLRQQKQSELLSRLRHILFESIHYDESLNEIEEARYRQANHYAGKYCQLFENRYRRSFGSEDMFNELREFYRLGQNAKLRRINNLS